MMLQVSESDDALDELLTPLVSAFHCLHNGTLVSSVYLSVVLSSSDDGRHHEKH